MRSRIRLDINTPPSLHPPRPYNEYAQQEFCCSPFSRHTRRAPSATRTAALPLRAGGTTLGALLKALLASLPRCWARARAQRQQETHLRLQGPQKRRTHTEAPDDALNTQTENGAPKPEDTRTTIASTSPRGDDPKPHAQSPPRPAPQTAWRDNLRPSIGRGRGGGMRRTSMPPRHQTYAAGDPK